MHNNIFSLYFTYAALGIIKGITFKAQNLLLFSFVTLLEFRKYLLACSFTSYGSHTQNKQKINESIFDFNQNLLTLNQSSRSELGLC